MAQPPAAGHGPRRRPCGVDGGGHLLTREHQRTPHNERRAGPACPAVGTCHRYPVYRWVPLRRAGACPRRRAALPTTTGVGAGIPDGPGWGAVWARQGCRALRMMRPTHRTIVLRYTKRPPSTTRHGVGKAALRLCRGDCAICGWRFGTMGEFAPCAARVFRPLRRAGISLAAASDQRLCLWKPRFFEKIE